MENESVMVVEVAYAGPDEQSVLKVTGQSGMTLCEAVEQSGILSCFPEIDWETVDVGVYGKIAKKDDVLRPGDRVEIYRPLIANPKEVRKKRAAEGKSMRRGNKNSTTSTEEKMQ